MEQKTFPDTEQGALEYLAYDSTLNLDGATATPDPSVAGVWMVHLDEDLNDGENAAIVYLAGHKDVWGRVRDMNDFETGRR